MSLEGPVSRLIGQGMATFVYIDSMTVVVNVEKLIGWKMTLFNILKLHLSIEIDLFEPSLLWELLKFLNHLTSISFSSRFNTIFMFWFYTEKEVANYWCSLVNYRIQVASYCCYLVFQIVLLIIYIAEKKDISRISNLHT